MRNLDFKKLPILVLIDFITFSLFYFFTKYVIRTIREYYQIIQNLTPQIDQFGFVLQQNSSLFDMNALGGNLELISQLSSNILLLLLLLGLVSFLLYNISQSINWNLALNEFKLRNYKNYLKKFTIISIPGFLILSYLIFKIIVNLKVFILDYWFEAVFNSMEFLIISLLSLICLIIIIIKFELYRLINKNSLKDSLNLLQKRIFKRYFYFILLIITAFASGLLFIFILKINPNSILLTIFASLVSLSILNVFRIYFAS